MSATLQLHNSDAEAAVLACCLHNPMAHEEALRHLVGSDFYGIAAEHVWGVLGKLRRAKRPVDPTSVMSELLTSQKTPAEKAAVEAFPTLLTWPTAVDTTTVADHAATVREWSLRRRLNTEAIRVQQEAVSPGTDMTAYAATAATKFAAIRDSGITGDITAKTLTEVLAEPDDEPDWLIPGLLERRDRLIVTGDEGLGKSHLLRQFAICAAAGLDPWDTSRKFDPVKVAIFDVENTEGQIRRKARGMVAFAAHHGLSDVGDRVNLRCSSRMDITRDKDLAEIHHELDAQQPDLVIIGPLYRLVPRAIQTDDDAAPVLAALDTLRDRGCALLIEAHSGHAIGKGGNRDMRPRGSSALLGWPEFGYGMRDLGAPGKAYCGFTAWRGNRSERDWPHALKRAQDGVRWIPYDGPTEVDQWS